MARKKLKKKPAQKKKTVKKVASPKPAPKPKSKTPSKKKTELAVSPSPVKKVQAVPVRAEIVESKPRSTHKTELTPLTNDALTAYLNNVNKYPLLTREQEQEIAERYYRDKNPKDAEILVTSNLRFVVKIAAEYSKFGNKIIDVIQEGNVGLMHAVKEFNPYKGVRLISYAVWWIRGYIQEYLMRQHSQVRIGTTQNQRKLFYHLQKEKNQLDQLGQEPTVKLLSTRLGIPEEDVKMMEERMSGRDVSLDAPLSEDGAGIRLDLQASDDQSIDEQLERYENIHLLEEKIEQLKPQLNQKELYILEKRLLAEEPITLQDIGLEWGVTREAVRQMESRVMKKIKEQMDDLK